MTKFKILVWWTLISIILFKSLEITQFMVRLHCQTMNCCSTNALCVKPLRNLEIKNLPKWWPWLPFSQARIISDENIWMISPLQFHFQSKFGYELKTVFCSSWIAKESVAIQTGCGKDVNQIEGTSWPEPLKYWIQIILMIQFVKIFEKYLYVSNVKFTMNGCRHKFVIF